MTEQNNVKTPWKWGDIIAKRVLLWGSAISFLCGILYTCVPYVIGHGIYVLPAYYLLYGIWLWYFAMRKRPIIATSWMAYSCMLNTIICLMAINYHSEYVLMDMIGSLTSVLIRDPHWKDEMIDAHTHVPLALAFFISACIWGTLLVKSLLAIIKKEI